MSGKKIAKKAKKSSKKNSAIPDKVSRESQKVLNSVAYHKKQHPTEGRIKQMGRNVHISEERIYAAIKRHAGLVSMIAKELKVHPETVRAWKSNPKVAAAFIEAKESTLDIAENKLITNIKKRDNTALIFYLKCQGIRRGYIEKQGTINYQNEYEAMNDDELDRASRDISRDLEAAKNRASQDHAGEITEDLPQ